jgi:tetratricopeptide (TPR) repeat protein
MKQPQVNVTGQAAPIPGQAQEIAREFARIGKLMEAGKKNDGWDAANALYAKFPGDPTTNFMMSLVLKEDVQHSQALPFAEAAVKLAPGNARYQAFLGKLYVDLRMIELAFDVLDRALALDNTLFQAPWALAHYYMASGQGSRALHYFDQTLKIAPPDFRATVLLDRGKCLMDLGNVSEAEPDFKIAMKDRNLRAEALSRLVLLRKTDHNSVFADAVRNELDRTDMGVKERSWLLLSLGRLHENGGDFDGAFLNFQESRKLLDPKYDAGSFVELIDDAIKVMTPGIIGNFKKFGHESEKPVFVVGMPRSGTTMTEQIIGAHSQAEGVGELQRIGDLARRFAIPDGMQRVLDYMAEVGPARWKETPQEYLNLLAALAPDTKHAVDKLPHNFLYLGFIHLCFPNARIVHCTRNPLDCFISAFQNPMSAFHEYSYDQVSYGEYYLNYLRLMNHWKGVMPDRIFELNYETLTASPDFEVRRMLNFLGLPWEESVLKFNERGSIIRTLSRLQVRKPINRDSVARWRNYEKHIGPIIAVFERAGISVQ